MPSFRASVKSRNLAPPAYQSPPKPIRQWAMKRKGTCSVEYHGGGALQVEERGAYRQQRMTHPSPAVQVCFAIFSSNPGARTSGYLQEAQSSAFGKPTHGQPEFRDSSKRQVTITRVSCCELRPCSTMAPTERRRSRSRYKSRGITSAVAGRYQLVDIISCVKTEPAVECRIGFLQGL